MTTRSRAISRLAALSILSTASVLLGCSADRAPAAYANKTPAADYPARESGYSQPSPASMPADGSELRVEAESISTSGVSSVDKETRPRKASSAPEPAPGGPAAPPPPPVPQAAQPGPTMKVEKADPTKEPAQSRDLVIYTARFTMAVYQVDQGLSAVEKIAKDNGGYLGQKKDREITVRVPRGRFETTLAAVDKIGDVLHREIQAEDVTDEHVDIEIRIKNARAMQKRLTDLLTKASVKDALEIEKELHRVTEQLERLEGRMKVLKDKVAFSTITVAFEPRGATIVANRARLPFPWLGQLNLPSLLSLTEDK